MKYKTLNSNIISRGTFLKVFWYFNTESSMWHWQQITELFKNFSGFLFSTFDQIKINFSPNDSNVYRRCGPMLWLPMDVNTRPIFVIGLAVSEVHLNIWDSAITKHNSSLIQSYPFEYLNNEISLIAKINCVPNGASTSNNFNGIQMKRERERARNSKSIL